MSAFTPIASRWITQAMAGFGTYFGREEGIMQKITPGAIYTVPLHE